jgi:hypothetical protein
MAESKVHNHSHTEFNGNGTTQPSDGQNPDMYNNGGYTSGYQGTGGNVARFVTPGGNPIDNSQVGRARGVQRGAGTDVPACFPSLPSSIRQPCPIGSALVGL